MPLQRQRDWPADLDALAAADFSHREYHRVHARGELKPKRLDAIAARMRARNANVARLRELALRRPRSADGRRFVKAAPLAAAYEALRSSEGQ